MPGRNYQRKTKERGLLYFCEGHNRVWQDAGVAGPWGWCHEDFPTLGKTHKPCPKCEEAQTEKESV